MMLSENLIWEVEESPYYLQGVVQIPTGVTLTIKSGVTVIVDGGRFKSAGIVKADGTKSAKILFEGDGTLFEGVVGGESILILNHSEIRRSPDPYSSNTLIWGQSTLEINDSLFENVNISGGFSLNFSATRTTFINFGGLHNSREWGQSPEANFVTNSCFLSKPPIILYSSGMYGGTFILNNNSIYGISPGQFEHNLKVHSSSNIDASNNYWDGLAEADVRQFVYDKTLDVGIEGTVQILPMLTEPHPDTPKCGD